MTSGNLTCSQLVSSYIQVCYPFLLQGVSVLHWPIAIACDQSPVCHSDLKLA